MNKKFIIVFEIIFINNIIYLIKLNYIRINILWLLIYELYFKHDIFSYYFLLMLLNLKDNFNNKLIKTYCQIHI